MGATFRSGSVWDEGQGLHANEFIIFFDRSVAPSGLLLGDCTLAPSALPFVLTARAASLPPGVRAGDLELDGWLTLHSSDSRALAGLSVAFRGLLVRFCAGEA